MSDKKDKNGSPQPDDELAALRQQLDDAIKEKDELFQQLQRLSADYANFQKRVPRQIADAITYEKEVLIRSLLPALDNFDHTLANAEKGMTLDAMNKGVQIVYSHLLDILKTHGIEIIDSRGRKFDPTLHQAILQKNQPDQPEDIVLEEFQRGYKLADRVIRPSRVVVNKKNGPSQPAAPDETPDTQ